jgi:hypothetical protein
VSLADLAARRRTHKAFGPEPVPRETLLELLDVARLAPNHHLTQPWRFRVLGPETLARIKECAGPGEAAKLDRAPTLVLATAALSGDLIQDEEDVCATAAAIMLVLLTAGPGGPDGERVLALLHFGLPDHEPVPRERAPVAAYVEFLD